MMKKAHKYPQHDLVYILTLAYGLSTFASGILIPIYAFFIQKIGGGILETSWAIATYSIICGLGTIFVHKTTWSHTYRRHLLWGGWLLWLLSMTVYLIIQNITVLYIAQILNALGDAICEPIFDAEFSEKISSDSSGGWAFFNGTISIFEGLASVAGGIIATAYGFDSLLYCIMVIGTISFALIVYYTRVNNARKATCSPH